MNNNTTSHATIREYFPDQLPDVHALIEEAAIRANLEPEHAKWAVLLSDGKHNDIQFNTALLETVAARLGICVSDKEQASCTTTIG